jgi:hypothetical protein
MFRHNFLSTNGVVSFPSFTWLYKYKGKYKQREMWHSAQRAEISEIICTFQPGRCQVTVAWLISAETKNEELLIARDISTATIDRGGYKRKATDSLKTVHDESPQYTRATPGNQLVCRINSCPVIWIRNHYKIFIINRPTYVRLLLLKLYGLGPVACSNKEFTNVWLFQTFGTSPRTRTRSLKRHLPIRNKINWERADMQPCPRVEFEHMILILRKLKIWGALDSGAIEICCVTCRRNVSEKKNC